MSEERKPYELSTATLTKLNMNKDLTEKETPPEKEETVPSEEVDEHGNEIKSYSDAEIGINIGDNFLQPKEKKVEKEKEKKPDKETPTDEATSEKEHPSSQPSESGEEFSKEHPSSQELSDFHKSVIEKIAAFEDAESQDKFLKDLENYEKFHKTNTETQQKLSSDRSILENFAKSIGVDKFQGIVQKVLDLDDLDDFKESSDQWYDDKGENPVRELIEYLESYNKPIKEEAEKISATEKEREELALEKELFALQKIDERYQKLENIQALGDIADKINNDGGVTLEIAHKLWKADNLDTKLSELDDQIKALKKDKSKLSKELKERNEEISQLKSKIPAPDTGEVSRIGAESFDYSTPSTGFDETEDRLRKKLGVESY